MSPFHWLGDAVRGTLLLIPLSVVRMLFVAVPLLLMVWVLRLPSSRTTPPFGSGRWDEDLKVWAWLALAFQVLVYCVL